MVNEFDVKALLLHNPYSFKSGRGDGNQIDGISELPSLGHAMFPACNYDAEHARNE
jgi:hypothetical protein